MEHGQCDLDHLLKLVTDSTKLEGTLHVLPPPSVKAINPDSLNGFLLGRDVNAKAIDQDAIKKLCETVGNAPLEPHQMVVARGHPAVNGTSVTYILEDEIEQRVEMVRSRQDAIKSGSVNTETISASGHGKDGATDTRVGVSHYDQMNFVIVQKGDKIAVKTDRSDGCDGEDIFGKIIPAREGKSNDGVLDESVLVAADGTCTALISGVLTATPSRISISDTLVIPDDVDFSTGRINFPGTVNVGGAVRDHFSIRATGDIEISGLVEVASLESEQSITLNRGMAGKESGTIRAGLDLNSRYLEGVNAEVGRDVAIKSEVTNSIIKIRGHLNAPNAAVRGGRIEVSRSAQIGSIGSVRGVITELVIGSVPEIERLIRSIKEFLELIESSIKSKTTKMESMSVIMTKPTPSQIEEQMGMQFEIDGLVERQLQLMNAETRLAELLLDNTETKLIVQKAIHAKSVVFLPGHRIEFSTDLQGESVIELGSNGHPQITHKGQVSDLKQYARVVSDDSVLRVLRDLNHQQQAA